MATWRFGLQAPLITCNNKNTSYHLKQTFFSFHWLRTHHVTCKWLPTNKLCNLLLMCNVIQLSVAAKNILLLGKINHAFLLFAITFAEKMADRFASQGDLSKSKLGDWMIKQLLNSFITKYCDLTQINVITCRSQRLWHSALANHWSACHWKITIFCSTSSNNC